MKLSTRSRRVGTRKFICSFLDVFFWYPASQKTPRLLSGTSSVLLDSMMMLWRHIGDGALLRQVEIWKLICSFLEVSLRHPPCQKPPRLLSGTSSVLKDSKDDTWPGVGSLSRRVETWKLICSLIDVSLSYPPWQKPPRLL